MNYQIVKDEDKLKEFIDWLPELKETEKYYMCLFARNKYCPQLTHIKSDKAQLKRFVSDKSRMLNKIRQLEIALGQYKQKEIEVPQVALALYITVNPREMWKASVNSMIKLAHCIRDQNILVNPHQEVMSEIQRSKSRTCYIDFDIDENDWEKLVPKIEEIQTYINPEACSWLRTRGGVHLLVDPTKVEDIFKSNFYQNINKFADQTGDNMIPVPGCTQGDYIPHFINLTYASS